MACVQIPPPLKKNRWRALPRFFLRGEGSVHMLTEDNSRQDWPNSENTGLAIWRPQIQILPWPLAEFVFDRPKFYSSAMPVNSQLVCLRAVGILVVMLMSILCFSPYFSAARYCKLPITSTSKILGQPYKVKFFNVWFNLYFHSIQMGFKDKGVWLHRGSQL